MKIAFITIFSLLLLISCAVASEVELTLSTNDMVGYAGETSGIEMIIKNNQEIADTFTVSIFPSQFAGVVTSLEKYIIWINSSSTEKVKLYFTVPMDAEEVVPIFTITVKSTAKDISDTETFYLRIVRKTDVYIKDIKMENYLLNPEEIAKIEVDVINIGITLSEKYYLETMVEKGGEIVKRYSDILEAIAPKSSFTVVNEYNIGKYDEPGPYKVEAVLKDSTNKIVSSKTTSFNVNAIYKLPTEYTTKDTSYNFFLIKVALTIKNEGNIASPSFYVTESVPGFAKAIFDPEIEPTKVNVTDGRVVYSWLIPTLEPGKQITIRYNYDLWRIWLIILIVGIATYGAFKLFYKPTIVKRYRHEGPITKEKEILVSLDVRNRTKHEVTDVEVRDVVPSIARVVEKFDTLTPRIRTTPVGTELRWKIDSLKPREERVITYRIRPVVEVIGSLNLPKAHVRYIDRKKLKRIIASKAVLVKG